MTICAREGGLKRATEGRNLQFKQFKYLSHLPSKSSFSFSLAVPPSSLKATDVRSPTLNLLSPQQFKLSLS